MIAHYKGKHLTELTKEELLEAILLQIKYTNDLLETQRKIKDINDMRYKDKKEDGGTDAR